jgi:thiamine-phosphate pyrophosphorylase
LLSDPDRRIVCYVTNGREFPSSDRQRLLLEHIAAAIDAGADWIQIREKDLSANLLCDLVREAVAIAHRASSARVIVNGRFDIALAAQADGVHLGAETIPAGAVVQWRKASGASAVFLVGVSCHNPEEAKSAAAIGADYIFFGPVFDSPAKRIFGEPQGIDRLGEICRSVRVPVLAIGGVNHANTEQCLRAGARGIAAIRLFQEGRDLQAVAQVISRIHSFG